MKNIEPIKFYHNMKYYFILFLALSLFSFLAIASINGNPLLPLILSFVFGLLVYLAFTTDCPVCKRSFVEKEDISKKKKINERIESKIHYDKKRYLYSDGTIKNTINGKAHEIEHKIITYNHHYNCKKCKSSWNKDKNIDLDAKTFVPKIDIIRTKEKNPLREMVNNFENNVLREQSNSPSTKYKKKKSKSKRTLTQTQKDKIIVNRDHICQNPSCGESGPLEVHHILPVSEGGGDNNSNLIVLCRNCHGKAHQGAFTKNRLKIMNKLRFKN